MITIGIDVGGTHTRVAAVEPRGRVLALHRALTPRDSAGSALVDWIVRQVSAIDVEVERIHRSRAVGWAMPTKTDGSAIAPMSSNATDENGGHGPPYVGLAVPGIIDRESGIVRRSINLPFLEDRPIVQELEQHLCRRVALFTDADAATWGEYTACKIRPSKFAHLRIGTGVACGIVKDGHIVSPDPKRKGHLDVLIVDQSSDAIECRCGKRGCLEAIVSGPALLERLGRAAPHEFDLLSNAFETQSDAAQSIAEDMADALVRAFENLQRTHQVEVISLGGGVIDHLSTLFFEVPSKWSVVLDRSPELKLVRVERARRGDDAGVIGAALLARAVD